MGPPPRWTLTGAALVFVLGTTSLAYADTSGNPRCDTISYGDEHCRWCDSHEAGACTREEPFRFVRCAAYRGVVVCDRPQHGEITPMDVVLGAGLLVLGLVPIVWLYRRRRARSK